MAELPSLMFPDTGALSVLFPSGLGLSGQFLRSFSHLFSVSLSLCVCVDVMSLTEQSLEMAAGAVSGEREVNVLLIKAWELYSPSVCFIPSGPQILEDTWDEAHANTHNPISHVKAFKEVCVRIASRLFVCTIYSEGQHLFWGCSRKVWQSRLLWSMLLSHSVSNAWDVACVPCRKRDWGQSISPIR